MFNKGEWMKKFLVILFSFILLGIVGVDISKAQAIDNVLTWVDNSGNNPAVNDQEDGFRVERKLNTGTYALLATVGMNVVTYTDSTAVAATIPNTYCYRVNAFNKAGTSAFSTEACKTIPALILTTPAPASNLTVK
jgi:hypothetical protein